MTWNYRVVRHRTRGEVWYGLHEVYYNRRKIMYLWSPEPQVQAESERALVATLATMLRDATKDAPILKKSEMPGQKKKGKR